MKEYKEYQGDIFGNWKPIEKVKQEIKCDKKFYSRLKRNKKSR